MEQTPEGCPRHLADGAITLQELLGEGGSGMVYRASSPEGTCAVKLRTVPERKIEAARFLVEAVPMAMVRHPRVVHVRHTGREGGFYWIAMDLYEHGTIADLVVEKGPVELDLALRLTEDVLDGLAAVHAAGFVHRDIKPHNIFLDEEDRAVVGDFGVARHMKANLWFRTRTGQAIGTQGYRAPEQDTDAKSAGPPADVYGMAVTLFYMITGKRPPLLYATEAQPAQLDPIPELLRPLLREATLYEPERRIQTAEDFRRRVRAVRNTHRAACGMPLLEGEPAGVLARLKQWWSGLRGSE